MHRNYNTIHASVTSAFNAYVQKLASTQSNNGELRDIKRRKGAADQVFFDAQKKHSDVGVGRQQTLQEVVVTFFLFSLVFFGIAITVHSYMTTHSVNSAVKTLGTYIFIMFVLLALILRYA